MAYTDNLADLEDPPEPQGYLDQQDFLPPGVQEYQPPRRPAIDIMEPWSPADEMDKQKLLGGLSQLRNLEAGGSLTPEEADQLRGNINRDLVPLQVRQARLLEQQRMAQKKQLMDEHAMAISMEMQGIKHQAQTMTPATIFLPDGSAQHYVPQKIGNTQWQPIDMSNVGEAKAQAAASELEHQHYLEQAAEDRKTKEHEAQIDMRTAAFEHMLEPEPTQPTEGTQQGRQPTVAERLERAQAALEEMRRSGPPQGSMGTPGRGGVSNVGPYDADYWNRRQALYQQVGQLEEEAARGAAQMPPTRNESERYAPVDWRRTPFAGGNMTQVYPAGTLGSTQPSSRLDLTPRAVITDARRDQIEQRISADLQHEMDRAQHRFANETPTDFQARQPAWMRVGMSPEQLTAYVRTGKIPAGVAQNLSQARAAEHQRRLNAAIARYHEDNGGGPGYITHEQYNQEIQSRLAEVPNYNRLTANQQRVAYERVVTGLQQQMRRNGYVLGDNPNLPADQVQEGTPRQVEPLDLSRPQTFTPAQRAVVSGIDYALDHVQQSRSMPAEQSQQAAEALRTAREIYARRPNIQNMTPPERERFMRAIEIIRSLGLQAPEPQHPQVPRGRPTPYVPSGESFGPSI